MHHAVLLGDSIFDNAAYVAGQPAVIDHLRRCLPTDWQATLCARDGAVINDIHGQLAQLPEGTSHLVLSVGGNDLLLDLAVLGKSVETVGEGLALLARIQERFRVDYERLLSTLAARALPVVLCTIFNPRFPDPGLQREAVAALCLFNDVIVRLAHRFGLAVIDLRRICTEDDDYATPIEPSTTGAAKIARAVADAVLHHDFGSGQAVLLP